MRSKFSHVTRLINDLDVRYEKCTAFRKRNSKLCNKGEKQTVSDQSISYRVYLLEVIKVVTGLLFLRKIVCFSALLHNLLFLFLNALNISYCTLTIMYSFSQKYSEFFLTKILYSYFIYKTILCPDLKGFHDWVYRHECPKMDALISFLSVFYLKTLAQKVKRFLIALSHAFSDITSATYLWKPLSHWRTRE